MKTSEKEFDYKFGKFIELCENEDGLDMLNILNSAYWFSCGCNFNEQEQEQFLLEVISAYQFDNGTGKTLFGILDYEGTTYEEYLPANENVNYSINHMKENSFVLIKSNGFMSEQDGKEIQDKSIEKEIKISICAFCKCITS